jgi:hypothetical protein
VKNVIHTYLWHGIISTEYIRRDSSEQWSAKRQIDHPINYGPKWASKRLVEGNLSGKDAETPNIRMRFALT